MAKTNAKATKKRKVIVESVGEAHITASFNNIIIEAVVKPMVLAILNLKML